MVDNEDAELANTTFYKRFFESDLHAHFNSHVQGEKVYGFKHIMLDVSSKSPCVHVLPKSR